MEMRQGQQEMRTQVQGLATGGKKTSLPERLGIESNDGLKWCINGENSSLPAPSRKAGRKAMCLG